jgi:hypothetical protein
MTTKAQRAKARASRYLTEGYPPELAAQMRATYPGQAHWAGSGPNGKTCGECCYLGYFKQRRNASGDTIRSEHTGGCRRYFELTGEHGPVVPTTAGACRHFETKQITEQERRTTMPSVDDRFPKSGFFSAKNWDEPGDLRLQISHVEYGVAIGFDKTGDVAHFVNDGRQLVLSYTIAHAIAKLHGKEMDAWPNKWIALFLDPDVEYNGKKTGGVRVRDEVVAGNGNAAVVTAPPPKPRAADFDDEIPF